MSFMSEANVRNNKMVKDENISGVLKIINENALISRIDISKKLGLSPPTISRIVDEITNLGLLECTEIGESSGGRKPILYKINKDAGYVIGIDIIKKEIKIGIFNFIGEKLNEYKKDILYPSDFINSLTNFLIEVIEEQKCKRILGIGVGMSGAVLHESGIVKYSNVFDYRDVPLKDILKSHINYPVFIEERVHCAALACKLTGSVFSDSDIIYMQVGSGIGAGIIIDGSIHYGKGDSLSGEVGHMILEADGTLCTCGSRGCLEQLSSEPALIRNVLEELKKGRLSIITDNIGTDYEKLNGNMIITAAEKGDKLALEALDKVCRYLAIAIVNLFMLFNPNKLVINNNISQSDKLVENMIFESLQKISIRTFDWKTKVIFDDDKDRTLKGCALQVIEKVMESPKAFFKE